MKWFSYWMFVVIFGFSLFGMFFVVIGLEEVMVVMRDGIKLWIKVVWFGFGWFFVVFVWGYDTDFWGRIFGCFVDLGYIYVG